MAPFLSQPGTQVQEQERRGGGSPFKTTLLPYKVPAAGTSAGLGLHTQGRCFQPGTPRSPGGEAESPPHSRCIGQIGLLCRVE